MAGSQERGTCECCGGLTCGVEMWSGEHRDKDKCLRVLSERIKALEITVQSPAPGEGVEKSSQGE